MADLSDALADSQRAASSFRWEIPDPFNFGRDVVDRFATDPDRPALLARSENGAERRLTFQEVREASDRFAHLLRTLPVDPGEPIIVMLPRVPEWQIVMVGALKAGVLLIPSSTILRAKDIVFRANHSRCRAIVACASQALASSCFNPGGAGR